MACRLHLFGSARLTDAGGRSILLPAKAFALVARLLLDPSGATSSRAKMAEFLWEGAEAQRAATNLRQLVARVREKQADYGFRLFGGARTQVALELLDVTIDLQEFQTLCRAESADLAKLCDLYAGELLEAFDWDKPDFREWLHVQRATLRNCFITAVTQRIAASATPLDPQSTRVAARRVLEIDPYNEAACRALMRVHGMEHAHAPIRELFTSLEGRLKNDLGVAPDRETIALYQSLLTPQQSFASKSVEPRVAAFRPAGKDDRGTPEAETHPSTGLPRVTILPPVPPPLQDYHYGLATSLVEDITIGLCRFKAFSVIAPHTAAQLTGAGKGALLRTHGIDYLVETQLTTPRGAQRLSVRLLRAMSREILWAEQYAFEDADVAQKYNELSLRIILSLIERVERAELARYDRNHEESAYRHFLTGQKFLNQLDLPHVRRARRSFKAALSVSPYFVPAISALARTYQREWMLMARGDEELLGEATRLAKQSVEIDPDDASGYRELGIAWLFRGAFDESLEALRLAEQRNPQHADLLVDAADALSHSSEAPAALPKVNRAIELNPLCPDQYWWVAGTTHYQMYNYQSVIDCVSRMRDQSPAYRLMAAACAMHGDQARAGDYRRKAMEIHPDFDVASWLKILPIQDRRGAEHYEEGLRKAGFV
jgi:DNA-binding SARP family transcriptional activator/TolB-like protein